MQTYALEIKYLETTGGSFIPNHDRKWKMVEDVRAKDTTHLRVIIFSKYLAKTGYCYVHNATTGNLVGMAFNYGNGKVFWDHGDAKTLRGVDPKTGKLRRV